MLTTQHTRDMDLQQDDMLSMYRESTYKSLAPGRWGDAATTLGGAGTSCGKVVDYAGNTQMGDVYPVAVSS